MNAETDVDQIPETSFVKKADAINVAEKAISSETVKDQGVEVAATQDPDHTPAADLFPEIGEDTKKAAEEIVESIEILGAGVEEEDTPATAAGQAGQLAELLQKLKEERADLGHYQNLYRQSDCLDPDRPLYQKTELINLNQQALIKTW